jgi:hypothetical protein
VPEARLTIIEVWQRETRVGSGAAHPVEAGGTVVPAGLERSEVKIEFFNYVIHGRAVRRACDQHGRLRLARPEGFAGARPPAKQ